MTFWDNLVALGVILIFCWIIVGKLVEKKPDGWIANNIKNLTFNNKIETIEPTESIQQVWHEKRSMI